MKYAIWFISAVCVLLSSSSIATPIISQPANPSGLTTINDFDPSIAWGNRYPRTSFNIPLGNRGDSVCEDAASMEKD